MLISCIMCTLLVMLVLSSLGTCQKLAGVEGGVETEGGVMKNGPLKGGGSCKYVSVIM